MDIVEFLWEEPFVFCVIDFELQVGGDAKSVSGMGKDEIQGTPSIQVG